MTTHHTRSLLSTPSYHQLILVALTILLVCHPCQSWTTPPSSPTRQQQRRHGLKDHYRPTTSQQWCAAAVPSSSSSIETSSSFTIRKCKYADLQAVSEIIMSSFYAPKMVQSPFAAVIKLKELDRLQQNFPYADDKHYMFVAVDNSDGTKIIGFCDLDTRKATRRMDPPRPYLSDLVVHPDHRRLGIATRLIRKCEGLTENEFKKEELYIRVERENDAAVQMYRQFEYQTLEHPIFGVEDTTVLLRKEFPEQCKNEEEDEGDTVVLDYVV